MHYGERLHGKVPDRGEESEPAEPSMDARYEALERLRARVAQARKELEQYYADEQAFQDEMHRFNNPHAIEARAELGARLKLASEELEAQFEAAEAEWKQSLN